VRLISAIRRERKYGEDHGIAGVVRIVAIDAVIAFTWATGEVPITGHAAVRAARIVPELRSVALGTKAHRVGEGDSLTVGEAELVVIRGVVATQAGEHAVLVLETLVEFIEFRRASRLNSGSGGCVTRATRNGDGLSLAIQGSGLDVGLINGLPDGDGKAFGSGRERAGLSCGRSGVLQGEVCQDAGHGEREDDRRDRNRPGLAPTRWRRLGRGEAW